MTGSDPRIDPDVDLRVPADRGELAARPGAVLGAVAVGGVLGALARAGLQHAFPHGPTGFPWAIFTVNLTGCFLIGVLMAALGRAGGRRPLLRPFLGVGVLGGYTTFSTYAVDIRLALAAGAPEVALGYLAATLVGALVAVWLGDALTDRLLGPAPTDTRPTPGPPAPGPPAQAAPEAAPPEHGAPEHGTPEHGTPKHGAPEHGAPEQGAPEHGTPEDGTRKPGAGR